MHELSVCRDIIEVVTSRLEAAGGGRLLKVYIETGPHSCVNTELIRSAFLASVKDTALEGADLAVRYRPLRSKCAGCGRIGTDGDKGGFRGETLRRLLARSCPVCGSRRRRQEIDDAVTIKSMEVEE
ncbi:MAG: hydrogenase maturation nickel metallochaperone HypA [Spirochaetia bacterium]